MKSRAQAKIWMVVLIWTGVSVALARADEIVDGRALFQGTRPFSAGIAATNRHLPIAFAACGNCHGMDGAGKTEGGMVAPAIDKVSLEAVRGHLARFRSKDAVIAAIESGIGRDGQLLGSVMPRYALAAAERDALYAYLGRVGTAGDLPPGVSADTIRLGLLLPLSGPLGNQGKSVFEGIDRVIKATNHAGGIHGRRIELIARDTAQGELAALNDLIPQDIHAIVGGMWNATNDALEQRLAEARIPVIASLVVRENLQPANRWISDLMASRSTQRRLLKTALLSCQTNGPRWLLQLGEDDIGDAEGVVEVTDDMVIHLPQSGAAGCLGYDLSRLRVVRGEVAERWKRRIVLPFPPAVLNEAGGDIWTLLGGTSARIAVEALSAAGASLHETSLIDVLPRLTGFEPIPGASVAFSVRRANAWDAGILALDPEDIGEDRDISSLAAAKKED
ncbi:ABC transporter substrate-binding protein [Rhizobium sp. PL01]|uniref:ABC transporter substrate-binding protein n=1 Tax=Rhizobium sp. PL01 TaxID=3085631 RepID=UPI0029827446|nr:ABC transporter substrate-binding protein [Rhizobium sp. PL01]MDW5316783.1 ABC transporter substrate-binding protein [Rhizobium sp. PL01]